MNRKILALIPARGGSKGILRKNIRPLAGKPLISWSIEAALDSEVCGRLIVSTDSPEIAAIAREWGADAPFLRPASLSTDTATSLSVVEHAVNWLHDTCAETFSHILLLQPTSPLRTAEDIQNAVRIAEKTNAAVVSVCEPQQHPYLCKIVREDGILADFIPESANYNRRQDFPPVFTLNGAIYIISVECLSAEKTFTPEKTIPYIMPPERSFDIDTSWDFFLAEQAMLERMKA
jgi:N-acylneuraminate cytidylyltransferase/CMP-N,N'-diacetyllegionaminic acid synthase